MKAYLGHLQTILGAKLPFRAFAPQAQKILTLEDGDQLALHINTSPCPKPEAPLAILFHGLCGSHQANYVTRIARKLCRQGLDVIRVDFRGCGTGVSKAKGLAHSGRSEDALAVLKWCHQQWQRPLLPIGFSMGGNIVLKCLGELGQRAAALNIVQAIAVSPPIDLAACADMMGHKHNAVFRHYFMQQLNDVVSQRHRNYPELGSTPHFDLQTGFWEFDEQYTAPYSGFMSAKDYYQHSSSYSVLQNIAVPCYILSALDDPFTSSTALQHARSDLLHITLTKRGGHLGFLGAPLMGPFRKMDRYVLYHCLAA